MTCDRCGEQLQIGSWPFCPHGFPVAGLSIIDDELDGGPRRFETMGHDAPYIASKSQWKREWQSTTDVPLWLVEGTPKERKRLYRTTRPATTQNADATMRSLDVSGMNQRPLSSTVTAAGENQRPRCSTTTWPRGPRNQRSGSAVRPPRRNHCRRTS